MFVSFDPVKNEANLQKHGLSLALAVNFNPTKAYVRVDDRKEYGEVRYIACWGLRARLHILCFTETEEGIRAISFRRANHRETKTYEKTRSLD